MKRIGFLLVLSALAFLLLVVWQRDHRIRHEAMAWATSVASEIRAHLAAHDTLPSRLNDTLVQRFTLTVPYPAGPQLPIARAVSKPFVLVAGPRLGLIQPGGDGCAAVRIAEGRVDAVWLTWDEALEVRATRAEVLPGG